MINNWQCASQTFCIDGVNSAVHPNLIGDRQVAWLLNGSVRGGQPGTRPGWKQRLILPTGKVQGAGYFSVNRGKIILSIGGRIHRVSIAGNNFSHDEIALPWRNSARLDSAWMQETVGNFIIQDGQSNAIIYDGAEARRADPAAGEVPIGRMMAFVGGRLWLVVSRYDVKAGDIYDGKDTELKFVEAQYLLGGGAFSFPMHIRALGRIPAKDSTDGSSGLLVLGDRAASKIRADVASRDLWQLVPGFITEALDVGAASQFCVIPVSQDLYWRDADGNVRSLRAAASEAAGPSDAGLSREISRITDHETDAWLSQSSGMFFDNRLFFTASPFRTPSGAIGFKKLISLDCAPLASMRGKAPPAYDGEWTGMNILRLVSGRFDGSHRAFAIVQDGSENSLWELTPRDRSDSYLVEGGSTEVAIRSAVEYRQFDFGAPNQLKQLERCDIYPARIEGEVNAKVYWRVGNRNQWRLWGEFSANAKMTDAPESTPETVHAWKNLRSQERGLVKSLTIPDAIDPVTNKSEAIGHSFQIRVVWTGVLDLERVDVWASPVNDPAFSDVADLPAGAVQATVTENEVSYTIKPA